MTGRAGIRDFVLICHLRRDEVERMTADIDIRNLLLDFRHVTRDAVTPWAIPPMVRMGFNRCAARAIR